MSIFDMKTVFFSYLVCDIICFVVMITLWGQNRKYFSGLGYWFAYYILHSFAIFLMILRDILPDVISIVAANFLGILSLIILYEGLLSFCGKKISQIHNYIILTVFILIYSHFSLIKPDLSFRTIFLSIVVFIICLQCMWFLLFKVDVSLRSITLGVGITFGVMSFVSLCRIPVEIINPSGTDFYKSGVFSTLFVLSYQMLTIILAFGMSNMVIQRLFNEIRDNNQLYTQMFNEHTAIQLLIDPESGKIVEANPAASSFYGYSLNVLESMFISQINILPGEEIFKEIKYMLNRGKDFFIFQHRISSGEIRDVEVRSVPIRIKGKILLYSIINDITDRKIAEGKIQYLLKEKEILLKEVHHRIKNNMNIIIGILDLHCSTLDNQELIFTMKDAISRIKSMSLLYDKLYMTNNFLEVSVKEYLAKLIDEIMKIFPDRLNISVEENIDDFLIDGKIMFSLGIIINEIITNAMKYAFTGMDNGIIQISVLKKENHITIMIHDNGAGISDLTDQDNTKGFGFSLVDMLTLQLKGRSKLENDNGTKFILEFDI
jgi:PAS domain S-box-containing protein